jgi:hypothetical protein
MSDAIAAGRGLPGLETKFRSFDAELALGEGAIIAGYASVYGAASLILADVAYSFVQLSN